MLISEQMCFKCVELKEKLKKGMEFFEWSLKEIRGIEVDR